jgi:hypothetical protein
LNENFSRLLTKRQREEVGTTVRGFCFEEGSPFERIAPNSFCRRSNYRRPEHRTHNYKRYATINLFAAFDAIGKNVPPGLDDQLIRGNCAFLGVCASLMMPLC